MIHNQYPIVVYTIYGCEYCKRAVKLLKQSGLPYKTRNIGSDANLGNALYQMTGSPSVPKVFIKGQFIGGFDQLRALAESGQLFHAAG